MVFISVDSMDRLPVKRRRRLVVPIQVPRVDPVPDWDEDGGGVFTQESARAGSGYYRPGNKRAQVISES